MQEIPGLLQHSKNVKKKNTARRLKPSLQNDLKSCAFLINDNAQRALDEVNDFASQSQLFSFKSMLLLFFSDL